MTERQAGPVHRSAPYYNQIKVGTLAATTAAQVLSATPEPVFEVILQNDPDSAGTLFVGNAFGQYFELAVGGSITLPVGNLNLVYVRAASTATANWIAMA